MNARKKTDLILMLAAFSMLLANLLNMSLWALGSSISLAIYLIIISVYLIFSFITNRTDFVILSLLFFLILLVLGHPLEDWDARSIWFFHAKRIFIDDNLYAQLDNYMPWSHNDYPVLIPALAATFAKTLGFWNEYLPKLSLILVILPAILIHKKLFNNTYLFNIWLIGIIFIIGKFLINGYMDGILALYTSASVLFLSNIYLMKDIDKKNYALFFLVLVTLPFIKNEGFLVLILILICLFPKIISNLKLLSYFLLSIIPYLVIWKFPVMYSLITNDLFPENISQRFVSRLFNPTDLILIAKYFFHQLGLFFIILILFIYKNKAEYSRVYMVLLFIILYTLSIVLIYLITPYDLTWHLGTSAERAFLTIKVCVFSMILFMSFHEKKIPIKMAVF